MMATKALRASDLSGIAEARQMTMIIATPTIESVHAQWIAAYNAHDLDHHVALYTQDATLFGGRPDLMIGHVGIRSYFSQFGNTDRVSRFPLPHIVMIRDDVAAAAGYVDFIDGNESVPYRMTWLLTKQDGNWKIAQHHGSPRR